MISSKKILLVGCGKMGSSLLKGWLAAGVKPANITVVEPESDLSEFRKVGRVLKDSSDVGDDIDFCIIAVKPQGFDDVVRGYNFLAGRAVFISIAAGKTIAGMEKLLGASAMLVRAMPNLPATVAAGVTAICANKNVSADKLSQVKELLGCVGQVVVLDKEDQMNAVTAISGSGPAYIFHIIEILNRIGIKHGLSEASALALAKNTVFGSGKLAMESSRAPEQLRIDVTSKGGTTEAALEVLMGDKKLENIFEAAIKAAVNRAKELQ